MLELPTGTVTFLFTHLEGSSQLWEQDPDGMREALACHDAGLRAAVERHHGRVFKSISGSYCAAFARPRDALETTLDVLKATAEIQILPLCLRMALHSGVAEAREEDYFGPTLNRVARLLAVGHGGQVLLSQSTADLLDGDLPPGASLRCLGLHRLRDLLRPEKVYQLLHPELPADFPPLHSLGDLSHNLPLQVTRFVGREREMAEIQQLLAAEASEKDPRPRLLTLTGTGGTGKSRLALQVAAELAGEFEDGVWLVELASLGDPARVPPAVAAVLQVRGEPNRPLAQTLADSLRSRHLLLILDNCEHLLAACASLVHALVRACPRLRILATSRERLNLAGEQIYSVPSLSLPPAEGEGCRVWGVGSDAAPDTPHSTAYTLMQSEAVQLFVDRALLVQPSFTLTSQNAPAVARVCRQLGGIPLAIELATARLKVLSVEQLAPRLEDMFRVLANGGRSRGPEAARPSRQETLRALIDWSYDSLSEVERTLLRRLSVFVGGFTLDAVEAICPGNQIQSDELLDLLGRLVDKSLVGVDDLEAQPRYRLLETIRQYASEKLWEAGEGAVARWRFRGWFLRFAEEALAERAGAERTTWRRRLVVEYDNLRAALGPAARTHPPRETGGERGDLPLLPTRLARWAQVAEQLVTAYRHMGRREAAWGILEDYLALSQSENNVTGMVRAYTLMGNFLMLNARTPDETAPRAMYQRAVELCEEHGLQDRIVEPHSLLAYTLSAAGTGLERAEALVQACMPRAEALANAGVMQRLYTIRMWIATHQADGEAFRAAFRASLAWGGPLEVPLHVMLGRIEARCRQRGAEAEFAGLCRDLREGYARAGLEGPYTAWYLGPAVVRPVPGEPRLYEPFDQDPWHPSLSWLDTTGRSRADTSDRRGWLRLNPAEGANLWPLQDVDAPRLVATVSDDFIVQARVELGPETAVLAGLLVWRDEGNFARLELQSRSPTQERLAVHLEACVGGQFHVVGRGQWERQPLWLRFEREGEELRAWCSPDGEQWRACGSVRFPPGETEQVGLAAISHGPNAHAWFDTLMLW